MSDLFARNHLVSELGFPSYKEGDDVYVCNDQIAEQTAGASGIADLHQSDQLDKFIAMVFKSIRGCTLHQEDLKLDGSAGGPDYIKGEWWVSLPDDPFPMGKIELRMKEIPRRNHYTRYLHFFISSPQIRNERSNGSVSGWFAQCTKQTTDWKVAERHIRKYIRKRSVLQCANHMADITSTDAERDTDAMARKFTVHLETITRYESNYSVSSPDRLESPLLDELSILHKEGYQFKNEAFQASVDNYMAYREEVASTPTNTDNVAYVKVVTPTPPYQHTRIDIVPMSNTKSRYSNKWQPVASSDSGDESVVYRYDNRNGWENSGVPEQVQNRTAALDCCTVGEWVTGLGVKLGEGTYCVIWDVV